jgi:23S rRNA pseudouridine1911/1915/1917 synthase
MICENTFLSMKEQVIYEDEAFIVALKRPGQDSEKLPAILGDSNFKIVNRLDMPVGGLILIGKNVSFCANLNKQIEQKTLHKEYYAVVTGQMEESFGEFNDYLLHDKSKNKSYPVSSERKGVKKATLLYRVLTYNSNTNLSLVKVRPITGRTHQIRVQFASRKHPLCGDGKYGSKVKGQIALFSGDVLFEHPNKKTPLHFHASPLSTDNEIWSLFDFDWNDDSLIEPHSITLCFL